MSQELESQITPPNASSGEMLESQGSESQATLVKSSSSKPPSNSESLGSQIAPTSNLQSESLADLEPSESPLLPGSDSASIAPARAESEISVWIQLLQSIARFLKFLAPWLWTAVILVVIVPLIGKLLIAQAFHPLVTDPNISVGSALHSSEAPTSKTLLTQAQGVDWHQVNRAMKKSLQSARQSAEDYALRELDVWTDEMMMHIDDSFLDWYFGYFNQKQIEYKSLFAGVSAGAAYLLNPSSPTPEERIAEVITEEFQIEFAKRVLRPQIAQLRMERLTHNAVRKYINELSGSVSQISIEYQIPHADWNRYLSEISVSLNDTEDEFSDLSLKFLTGGGAYFAVKPLVAPLALKVGSKVVPKLAGKAGAKLATKTGATLAGKLGSAMLDATVGVGIILWDVWDNNHTASIEKPILRENLADYLQEVKYSLLSNPENGIMTAVDAVQAKIIESIDLAYPI